MNQFRQNETPIVNVKPKLCPGYSSLWQWSDNTQL